MNFENESIKIFCDDNMNLLKLQNSKSVDLIYCDILFGTGKNFFDYRDLRPIKNEIVDHYYPRFIEMKRVLKETGNLYIHVGIKISHWIRVLLDEVFNYENFRNEIIWEYNSAPRKKKCFGNRHDVIYRYSASNNFKFNEIREPYSTTAPRGYNKEKYYHNEGKVIGDVWKINMISQNNKTERVNYKTQKPIELIKRIILSSTDEGDVVADYYLGSGTTALACKQLKRKFIGCDINPKSIEITKLRINEF